MMPKNDREDRGEIKAEKISQSKWKIEIIFQDEDILVINKPTGLQVHPDGKNLTGTLANYLLAKYPEIKNVGEAIERPGIVHRLDRDTSGLMMIVKNNQAFRYYKRQFQQRKMEKAYWTLVHGKMKDDSGEINLSIGRSPKHTEIRSTADYAKDKKEARTFYKVLERFEVVQSPAKRFLYTLCEVRIETGRTHQIRVHLKSMGYPVAGDIVYKFKRLRIPVSLKRMFLVAKKLEFVDRAGKKKKFEIEIGEDLQGVLREIRD